MLAEFAEQLYLVYTPAYDPDANRIEWLWRVSRRIVTHNHHRSTFELLLTDVQQHFRALARTPAEVLRHIGSPFAPDKDHDAPLTLAQACAGYLGHPFVENDGFQERMSQDSHERGSPPRMKIPFQKSSQHNIPNFSIYKAG